MTVQIIRGDCRETLKTLPEKSVHCCVTSPPYFGLRDYGMADQIGLEQTPEAFVAELVAVFREVRRVLRDDGTLWLNLGDSYAAGGTGGASDKSLLNGGRGVGPLEKIKQGPILSRKPSNGLKPKDLIGIPWRVAFALQADGWWLRQDIIWAKPNPMPESVTDRCTKSHEYVFLMTKSARYFFDAEAIREQTGNEFSWEEYAERTAPGAAWQSGGITQYAGAHKHDGGRSHPAGRNKRSVWTIPSQAYSDAHFATFPEALVEPMILAGTSAHGHCPECGKGWVRVVERDRTVPARSGDWKATGQDHRNDIDRKGGFYPVTQTLGWQPSCDHNLAPVPGVVLDPFLGSGTTARVAQSLGRNWLGIELNEAYGKLQDGRITQQGFAFA